MQNHVSIKQKKIKTQMIKGVMQFETRMSANISPILIENEITFVFMFLGKPISRAAMRIYLFYLTIM